jgi:hypothetical protein
VARAPPCPSSQKSPSRIPNYPTSASYAPPRDAHTSQSPQLLPMRRRRLSGPHPHTPLRSRTARDSSRRRRSGWSTATTSDVSGACAVTASSPLFLCLLAAHEIGTLELE